MKSIDYNSLFVPVFKRGGSPFLKGKGMYLYDTDGGKYLDFGAGIAVNALGHAHPVLIKALRDQGSKLIHLSNLYFSKVQIDLARLLRKHTFGGRVFFCNSGTEANEAAFKFARKWAKQESPEKYHILSFHDGFHGRTYGALSATAQEKFHTGFEPMLPGFHFSPLGDVAATKKILSAHPFAAIIIEPLQGEGGVNEMKTEFLKFLRDYSDKHKIALIFDEIQCGMGRTGTLWHYEQHGVIPDILTLAKPVGGGLPLGAVLCSEKIAAAMSYGDHGTTFGGNPVACALGIALLKTIAKRSFLTNVKAQGDYLRKKLSGLKEKYSQIHEVRGCGLLVGVRMKQDPSEIIDKCKDRGLLVIKANHNTVRFIPPLIVTKRDTDEAIRIFSRVLDGITAKK